MEAASLQRSKENELTKLILEKEHEIKQLHQKEEKLSEIELICQQQKEYLLEQYKSVFPGQIWSLQQNGLDKITHSASGNQWHDKACNLVCEIRQHKEQNRKLMCEVREAKAEKQLRDTYNFVTKQKDNEMKMNETLLFKWYKIIRNQIHSDAMVAEQETKQLPFADKLFYHASYQDCTSKDFPVTTLWSVPGKSLESLLFSTRHNGICVAVTIKRGEKTTARRSTDTQVNQCTGYEVLTDPYIENCEQALDFLPNCGPEEFVRQVVWNFIDSEKL